VTSKSRQELGGVLQLAVLEAPDEDKHTTLQAAQVLEDVLKAVSTGRSYVYGSGSPLM